MKSQHSFELARYTTAQMIVGEAGVLQLYTCQRPVKPWWVTDCTISSSCHLNYSELTYKTRVAQNCRQVSLGEIVSVSITFKLSFCWFRLNLMITLLSDSIFKAGKWDFRRKMWRKKRQCNMVWSANQLAKVNEHSITSKKTRFYEDVKVIARGSYWRNHSCSGSSNANWSQDGKAYLVKVNF